MRESTAAFRAAGARAVVAYLLAVALAIDPGTARSAEDPGRENAAGPRVRELSPELFYVEDDAGRLVPVPGFRYRDFVDLFRLKEGLGGPLEPPAAVIESLTVRIDARPAAPGAGRHADAATVSMPAEVECVVRQVRGGWTPVVIGLGRLLLSEPPAHDGPGRLLVDAAAEDAGYRLWFDAPLAAGAEARHTVAMRGQLPGDALAGGESAEFRLPAAVASLVEIRSERVDPVVTIQPAGRVQRVTPDESGEGSSISIAGLAGAVRIRIGSSTSATPVAAAPQVVCESVVRIDGRNAVTAATLTLENLPASRTTLPVTLPPQARVRTVRGQGGLVARGGTADAPTVAVALEPDAQGRAVVEIECERPIDPTGVQPADVLGFAVTGIEPWRQWGRVSLVVEGDWQATWAERPGLRRVDPPPTGRMPGFVASFAYDSQPASLPLQVLPRLSRTVIEPEYRYHVGDTRITLDARVRVAARGAPVGSVVLDLDPAWSLEDAGPATVVDAGGIRFEDGRLVLPFVQSLAGDALVEIRASRRIDRDTEQISWALPAPRADLVAPALVVIASDSDIELLPDSERIEGLIRQTAAALAQTDVGRGTLAYRLDAAAGTFAATRRFLTRRVDATLTAQARVDRDELIVDEVVRLVVLHVPLEFVEFTVPTSVALAGTFEVRQDEEPLDPFEVAAVAADDDKGIPALTRMRAILPEPLLGEGAVQIRFRVPAVPIPDDATVMVDLPLAVPTAATVGRQTVSVAADDALVADVRGEAWRRDVGAPVATGLRTWSASKPQHTLPLALSHRPRDVGRSLVVEAAWLQTRLLPATREDVFTYAVSAVGDSIVISIPRDAADRAVERTCDVWLDGAVVPGAARDDGRIVITLPRSDPGRRWLVEVRQTAPRGRGWARLAERYRLPGPVPLVAPQFEAGAVERRFYWSVHHSSDEALLGAPFRWTSQQRWRPGRAGWQREAVVAPREIAAWVREAAGAAPAAAGDVGRSLPPLAAEPRSAERAAVYAGVGSPGDATPWLLPAWFTVLVAGGAALAVGLAIVQRPWLRRSSVIVSLLAACAMAAAAFPDAAPVFLQAALPGAGLALVAAVIDAWTRRRPAVRPGGAAGGESGLTRAAASLIVAESTGSIERPRGGPP